MSDAASRITSSTSSRPSAPYTAADWARDALATIDEIEARGRTALLVGGTGFYLRALREPFFEAPPTDIDLRRRLLHLRERRGAEHLHQLLQRLDPERAARLAPRDWSRVQRALELRLQTGEKLSARMEGRPAPPPHAARLRVFVLNPPRAELYRRIDRRAEAHFRAGLVEEVRGLLARGVPAEEAPSARTATAASSSTCAASARWRAPSSRRSSTCATTPSGSSRGSGARWASSGSRVSAKTRPCRRRSRDGSASEIPRRNGKRASRGSICS